MADLPVALKGLSVDQLGELQDLAETKSWHMATEIADFNDREKELIARATDDSPAVAKTLRARLYRRYLWDSLRWFLFGGYVDLVGFREHPLRAYDPDSNPYLKLWVPGWAKTQDEHDESSPYKPLPDKDYLRLFAFSWVNSPKLAVPKSRQMLVTWLFCAIAAHTVMFRDAQRIAVISKKEADANALIQRTVTVLKGLPVERFHVPAWRDPYAYLHVDERDSHIHAMGEEAKAIRSYTFSWIFSDEAAFQEQFREYVRAALATVAGGSRLTLVSTSNGEEGFHDIVTEGGRIPCPPGR